MSSIARVSAMALLAGCLGATSPMVSPAQSADSAAGGLRAEIARAKAAEATLRSIVGDLAARLDAIGATRPAEGAGVFVMRLDETHGGIFDCAPSCYMPSVGVFSDVFFTESDTQVLSPATTIVGRDLAVETSSPAPFELGGGTRTFILRVNGEDTALQCTEQPQESTCRNTTAEVVIPPGSKLALKFAEAGAEISGAAVFVSWRATLP